ncbi:MAG TPA: hypothetical protein VHN14_02015, partial [Kofleriaceae bacterium]|nr:hypothetical protein [Kofleriaceae bacterium]
MTPNTKTLCLVIIAACTPSHPEVRTSTSTSAPASSGLDLAGMDRSIVPGNDFFAYANGGWIKSHEIPPDRASYGTGAIVDELTAKRTAELITLAAQQAPANADARKIADYYASYLDEAGIAAKGLAPVSLELSRIAALRDVHALASALGGTLRADVDVLNNTNYD